MPTDTHCAPLSSWARPVVTAVALAYRTALGERGEAMEAYRAAADAFLAAGGAPEAAAHDVALILAAVARDHLDWLYRPTRERIAREEAWWQARGVWPPPKDPREWPAEL